MKVSFVTAFAAVAVSLACSVVAVDGMYFNRNATFYVCSQTEPNCNTDDVTVAEIVDATPDGMKLFYTDSESEHIGVVDISDFTNPVGLATISVEGEPTSVAVVNDKYAVAGVNTSPDFVNVSGQAVIIDVETLEIVRTIELGGQPDAVAVSPDQTFVAIAIENERDEDLDEGRPPQLPPGYLVVMNVADEDPMNWSFETVDLDGGLEGLLFDNDPEPEYVAINSDNICVVTLQENNAIVLVDLATLEVTASFSAGSPLVEMVDVERNGIIEQTGSIEVPREPDAVTWVGGTEFFATADEGDMDGGSRGFTIFDTAGNVVYDSGNELEWWAVRVGQYPESRSSSKGNEPEGILYAEFGDTPYLFVLSERSSVIFVYTVDDVTAPQLVQILPSNARPEGVVAIPERNLLVVASELDERGDKMRSGITIYELVATETPIYPTLISNPIEGETGPYIPFSALSGLASDAPPTMPDGNEDILYSIEDSYYKSSRMFIIDVSTYPAVVTGAIRLTDSLGTLSAALETLPPGLAVNASTTTLINEDQSVNLDLEGISKSVDGGFWIVSEGSGTMGDTDRPYEYPNMLLKVSAAGVIEEAIFLPESLGMVQLRFGFEGVAEDGDYVVVAMQRAWGEDPDPRLAIYSKTSGEFSFVFYPLDEPESQGGGWVGLSDISPLGDGKFLVLERDDQSGPDAAIKKLYSIDLGDFSMGVAEEGGAEIAKQLTPEDIPTIEKTLVLDLIPVVEAATNAKSMEKFEGLAVTASGITYINNDNDGVEDNSGEQLLLNLGVLLTDDGTPSMPTESSPSESPVETPTENGGGSGSSSAVSLAGAASSTLLASCIALYLM
ncbi:alkaline phosphatase-like protein [Nitzschia inconspicua]|uniref:Alkaline phosphatase-like protein n=1 Tax=Nitzschia inconspicua TaxID=303405 RepID=A0A9K3LTN5_9STRA|nr:alkaline phosphatase-like protein [Nitzschia inconspicua]